MYWCVPAFPNRTDPDRKCPSRTQTAGSPAGSAGQQRASTAPQSRACAGPHVLHGYRPSVRRQCAGQECRRAGAPGAPVADWAASPMSRTAVGWGGCVSSGWGGPASSPPSSSATCGPSAAIGARWSRSWSRVRNRVQKVLDRSGVRIGAVLSDVFGANGRRVLDGLIGGLDREGILASLSGHASRSTSSAMRCVWSCAKPIACCSPTCWTNTTRLPGT